jgi:hypothetical protein
VISPSLGLSTYTLENTNRIDEHRLPCLEQDFEPTTPAFERAKKVHVFDLAATVVSWMMRQTRHKRTWGARRNAYWIFVTNLEGKRPVESSRHNLEDNIKIEHKENRMV